MENNIIQKSAVLVPHHHSSIFELNTVSPLILCTLRSSYPPQYFNNPQVFMFLGSDLLLPLRSLTPSPRLLSVQSPSIAHGPCSLLSKDTLPKHSLHYA